MSRPGHITSAVRTKHYLMERDNSRFQPPSNITRVLPLFSHVNATSLQVLFKDLSGVFFGFIGDVRIVHCTRYIRISSWFSRVSPKLKALCFVAACLLTFSSADAIFDRAGIVFAMGE